MGMDLLEYCNRAMSTPNMTTSYKDKDGNVFHLVGNHRITTNFGYTRDNAIMNILSFNNGRTYECEVKAYDTLIAHMVFNVWSEEAIIYDATITSRTDISILSDVARELATMGISAHYFTADGWVTSYPITYSDFKAVAKQKHHYSIRHDRPLLRKGGYC